MKSTSCEIPFPNNPSKVFHSGQMLYGRVVLKFTKPKTVRGIYIKVIGRAYCEWTSGSGRASKTHIGNQFYLNEKMFLVGGESRSEVCVRPNEYNYIFTCMLPLSLPTSIEGEIGYNRYKVVVYIDRSTFAFADQKFKSHFMVIKPFNLNDEVDLKLPIEEECQKVYCVSCFTGDQFVDVSVRIPFGGYVPGQIIELSLHVNNRSGQTFRSFVLELLQILKYHTHPNSSKTKTEKIEVNSASSNGGCGRYRSGSFTFSINVPALPPTDDSACNIIKVNYQLRIVGKISCSADDPILTIPVKIGTFPIIVDGIGTLSTRTRSELQQIPGNSFLVAQNTPTANILAISDTADLPTYEEAVYDFADDLDADAFRPSYPVFRQTRT